MPFNLALILPHAGRRARDDAMMKGLVTRDMVAALPKCEVVGPPVPHAFTGSGIILIHLAPSSIGGLFINEHATYGA